MKMVQREEFHIFQITFECTKALYSLIRIASTFTKVD